MYNAPTMVVVWVDMTMTPRRFLNIGKDGGPESNVTGYWLAEIKSLFSVALLRFDDGSRDAYHSHAFNCISWVLTGKLEERHLELDHTERVDNHTPSLRPVITRRSTFHRVISRGTTWVLTFRGPWSKEWHEYDPHEGKYTTLTFGRKVMNDDLAHAPFPY